MKQYEKDKLTIDSFVPFQLSVKWKRKHFYRSLWNKQTLNLRSHKLVTCLEPSKYQDNAAPHPPRGVIFGNCHDAIHRLGCIFDSSYLAVRYDEGTFNMRRDWRQGVKANRRVLETLISCSVNDISAQRRQIKSMDFLLPRVFFLGQWSF